MLPNHLAMTSGRRSQIHVLNSQRNCFHVSMSAVFCCQTGEPWFLPYACVSRAEVLEFQQQPPLKAHESTCSYPLPLGPHHTGIPSKAPALKAWITLLLSDLQRAKKWPLSQWKIFPAWWYPHYKSGLATSSITTRSFLFCLSMFTAS